MLYTENLQKFYSEKRIWQGIPAIEKTKNGTLFSAFYSGGTREGNGNFCVLVRSRDDGATWSEPIAVAYNGEQSRCFDNCLWIDPIGRLWFIWSVMPDTSVWCAICDNPDAENLSWSGVRRIADGVMMNKPTVLSTGEWLFPIAMWSDEIMNIMIKSKTLVEDFAPHNGLPFVYKTVDNGETFTRLGGPVVENRSFDEHMVVELNDGSLEMLTRTNYGIAKSYSSDGGCTWTDGVDSTIGGPCSRFCIRRLKSGKLVLINHYNFSGRNNLYAMLSDDDGKTWYGYLLLDERANVSYPDLIEDDDGYVYVIYDRERGGFLRSTEDLVKQAREILMAKITEKDIAGGKLVSDGFLKKIISKLEGANEEAEKAYAEMAK